MANIQKLSYPYFTDGTTVLGASTLNPIIAKINELVDKVNGGVTPTTVATPVIIINGNSATITCATSGATIRYTTDGSTPTSSSTQYTGAITLSGATTIKAIAIKDGVSSSVATQSYTPASVSAPIITISGNSCAITCATSGATIYYTTNGNNPTSSSTQYSGAITLQSACTVKAIAIKDGVSSSVSTASYTPAATPQTILSSYYSANNTISASEKSALETLVQGLIDNNLWSKFKYFYPMCGTSVADQLKEVVNPSTDDILGNTDTSNLSVSSRKLEVAMTTNANKKGDKVLGSRVQTLNLNDISYISAFNYKDDTGVFSVFNQYYNYNGKQSPNAVGLTETYGGNKCARISGIATTTIASTDAETVSIGAERIVMGRQIDTDLSVFHDTTKFKAATLQTGTTCVPFGKAKALLEYASANGGENAVEMGLYAITTGLTDAQWGTVHGLVRAFLVSIGKHTA